jgi:hypothetical protein
MPHASTEDQLVEQPAIGLFVEFGPVSSRGESPPYSETVAVRRRAALIEWLTAGCCKSLISSWFLFE